MDRFRVPVRRRLAVLLGATVLVSTGLFAQVVSAVAPSNFVDVNNHQVRWSGTGNWDWAKGAASNPAVCVHPTTVGGVQTCPGTNGLFDGGVYNGVTVPPTKPNYTGPSVGVPVGARDFIVDPLSIDHTTCVFPPTAGGSATAITGDPTVYTGSGSETNGDLLTSDTWGNGSTPNKDEISNVYAVGHRVEVNGQLQTYEIFFGAERVVNNGDSHIDFEFLQSVVALVPDATGCAGSFSGNRSQGDMLLSVDFTSGGTFGGNTLYQWHCAAESGTQPAIGTVCNPPKNGKSVPHYQQTTNSAVNFGVNGGGSVDCGGWVCRNSDGSLNTTIQTNELMEGGINLLDLGFTGCLSSFLPHTRSSQSFTATLKDFALANFNTCSPTTALSVSPSASQLVHKGDSKLFTFSENNDGNVALTSPRVDVTFSPSGPTGCGTTTLAGGDTNSNGILDPGETFQYTCTANFPTAGIFTVTGTAHGTFNGNDITYPGDPEERTQTEVRVIAPATTLTKTPSAASSHIGDTVTYTYSESNGTTGGNVADRAISGVSVSDDKCSPVNGVDANTDTFNDGDTNSNGKLDATETWTFTCTSQPLNAAGVVTNTATATGTDEIGSTVTWCAAPGSPPANTICSQTEQTTAQVTVINPNTTLTKLVTATVNATYTFKEANTGNVILTNPSVGDSDSNCSPAQVLKPSPNATRNIGDANNDGNFDPNETWTWSCTVTALLTVDTDTGTATLSTGTTQNTATGHGTDPLGRDITVANGYLNEQDKTTVTVTVSHP
jgi:hypothetical protein